MKRTLNTFLISSAVFISGCTDRTIQRFSSLYDSPEFNIIQQRIYDGEGVNVIPSVQKFYNCTKEEAEEFVTAQRAVYEIHEKQTPARNFVGFHDEFQKKLDEISALQNLESCLFQLDPSTQTKEKFERIKAQISSQ